jgi:hypothetical protein
VAPVHDGDGRAMRVQVLEAATEWSATRGASAVTAGHPIIIYFMDIIFYKRNILISQT